MTQPRSTAPSPVDSAVPARQDEPFCRNCGAPLAGAFCSDCSQRADVHMPSTLELIHEAVEGITHSDSRLWATLRYLMFKPGKLTVEFIAGRRMSYLPPFRLYLVMSVMFFLIASAWQRDAVHFVQMDDATAPADGKPVDPKQRCKAVQSSIFEAQLRNACESILRDEGEAFKHQVLSAAPKAMFVFLPMIAFFHMLLYWWPRHRYAEHLLFFLHAHAFAFLAMSVMWVLSRIGGLYAPVHTSSSVLIAALATYMPVYVVVAMRRVFRRSWFNTLVKASTLFFIYMVALALTMVGVVLYAAWGL